MPTRKKPEEEPFEPQNPISRMRDISGRVHSNDPLVKFLYLLTRDEVPTGRVEDIINQISDENSAVFTNGWLAEWAKDAAMRLTKGM